MKVVFMNPFFTDGMGYIENCLPRAMAKRGHEVHLVTSTGKVYFNDPVYKATYEKFFGPPTVPAGTYQLEGNVTHHRLDYFLLMNTFYFRGLHKLLREIEPDIIHMWDVISPYTIQVFYFKSRKPCVVYTGNHYVLSVLQVHNEWESIFSMLKWKWYFLKMLPGKLFSHKYKRCYAATDDAKYIAEKYMGVPANKCVVTPLGVDTHMFKPEPDVHKRNTFRATLGLSPDDFVVLYTGRFTAGKNPLVMARAVDKLRSEGLTKIKGVFVGSGDQKEEIKACSGCTIVDFVLYHELFRFYQIADVGVWPAQESTSMLDAAATGVPIIVNNTIQATERYEGNGLTYELGNSDDMAAKIKRLYNDTALRSALGASGQKKMSELYSWDKIAMERERDYQQDLNGTPQAG